MHDVPKLVEKRMNLLERQQRWPDLSGLGHVAQNRALWVDPVTVARALKLGMGIWVAG